LSLDLSRLGGPINILHVKTRKSNYCAARAELNSGCEDRGDLLKHVKVTQWVRGRLKSHPTKG
jgi:hypothetical protein